MIQNLKKKKNYIVMMLVLILVIEVLPVTSMKVEAGIKDATVFKDVKWKYLGETGMIADSGWLQSMCCTKDYIICLENTSNKTSEPDTLLALYRNDKDANGKTVKQYSVAKKVTETDYEHGNGMAYNPNTNEILIVGATPLNAANLGVIYIVDGSTLRLKRKVKLNTSYKLCGISYYENENCYVVQLFDTGFKNTFFIRLDVNSFKQIGKKINAKTWNNVRYQDFCISGDYLISLAFTYKKNNSNEMLIYSLETNELMAKYRLNINGDKEFIEPESICELGPGEIMIANAMKNPTRFTLYKTNVAAAFKLSTSIENGEITGSQKTVDYGSDYEVVYTPYENYEIKTITVDGENIDINQYPNSYSFSNISKNHNIVVNCVEKPKFTLMASVENGFVDGSVIKHRDNDVIFTYGPNNHYELDEILVDGEPVDLEAYKDEYVFENIQSNHTIEVRYKECQKYTINTEVTHGTITDTTENVYENENCRIYYEPQKDYALAWVEIDGKRQYGYEIQTYKNDYLFENINQSHEIKVVYYWKYMPILVMIFTIVFAIFIVSLIFLNAGVAYRRYLRKKVKRRRMIKKRIAENRKKAEERVREKMQIEALFDQEP